MSNNGNTANQAMESLERLLSVKEVAQRLGCSEANVYALLDQGILPYLPVGKQKAFRIDPTDLESFIQSRKIQNMKNPKTKTQRPKLKHIKLKTI